jgi:predicted phage tail protein
VDYPALEPDPSLVRVSASLYQRECQRVKSRFEEAVTLAEQSFATEFRKLVEHIVTRLQGLNDGTSKQFREENLTNLQTFFERFKSLSIGSNDDLERLVEDAQQAVQGYQPDWLEESQPLRDVVRGNLSQIQSALDALMVAKPKRKISWDD